MSWGDLQTVVAVLGGVLLIVDRLPRACGVLGRFFTWAGARLSAIACESAALPGAGGGRRRSGRAP